MESLLVNSSAMFFLLQPIHHHPNPFYKYLRNFLLSFSLDDLEALLNSLTTFSFISLMQLFKDIVLLHPENNSIDKILIIRIDFFIHFHSPYFL